MVVGKITAVFGIKGWVKIHSYTETEGDLSTFGRWYIEANKAADDPWQLIEFDEWRNHNKGLIAHIKYCDDRETAQSYCKKTIAVDTTQLPELSEDDFVTRAGDVLGEIKEMLETGANDVMIVSPTTESIDDTERLIPWVVDQVVLQVSRANKTVQVDWQPDYLS